jgi:hypothetical protein
MKTTFKTKKGGETFLIKTNPIDTKSNYNLGVTVFLEGDKMPFFGTIAKAGTTKAQILDFVNKKLDNLLNNHKEEIC